jgi:hypothetical protein
MKNRASSFPADVVARPWRSEPWPWLIMLGPFLVVIAAFATAWIAVKSDDGLVEQDYYKRGLLINRQLQDAPTDRYAGLAATIDIAADGIVHARLDGAPGVPTGLRLTLARPAGGGAAQVIVLRRADDGDYRGVFTGLAPGRWIVTLEGDGWRLPTTTVVDRLTGIRLGAAGRG